MKNYHMLFAALLIGVSGLLTSCTTTVDRIEAIRPPDLAFEESEPYTAETGDLDDLFYEAVVDFKTNIKYAKLNDDGTLTIVETNDNASHVLLDSDNYVKVGDIISIADSYKKIIREQENLVNLYVLESNKLKELMELERYKSQILTDSWAASENLYRQERALRQKENVINKFLLYGTNALWIVGAIAVL